MNKQQKEFEETEAREANVIKFILDSSEWPSWPILPLKRQNTKQGFPDTGYLFEGKGAVVNLLNLKGETVSKIKYIDFNAMIDAGWEID